MTFNTHLKQGSNGITIYLKMTFRRKCEKAYLSSKNWDLSLDNS